MINIALIGNPNVGKSTIFNALTGKNQHTGNWTGKTVEQCSAIFCHNNKKYQLIDLPGTYSLDPKSPDEAVTRDYLATQPDLVVIVADAMTLERSLYLVLQTKELCKNIILAINLLDEARRHALEIDIDALAKALDIVTVGVTARDMELNPLLDAIDGQAYLDRNNTDFFYDLETERAIDALTHVERNRFLALQKLKAETPTLSTKIASQLNKHITALGATITRGSALSFKVDKILCSRVFGLPIVLLFLSALLFITIALANIISEQLGWLFGVIENAVMPICVRLFGARFASLLVEGVFRTLGWVVAVMLPPMAIFFPVFTYLEELGFLPRLALNLDRAFKRCDTNGRQALTMCMGIGCNACAVVGARIIRTRKERLIAIVTNSFIPCNGRFPLLIAMANIFIGSLVGGFLGAVVTALVVAAAVVIGILMTFLVSKILSVTALKSQSSEFIMEIPPFRRPKIRAVLRTSGKKIGALLLRAVAVAAPSGVVLWVCANTYIGDTAVIAVISNALDPIGRVLGLDGVILLAFALGIAANEIVLPIIIMCYMSGGALVEFTDFSALNTLFTENGWTILTAVNMMLFTLLHFPCATTLISIKKETGSWRWTAASFVIPLAIGITACALTAGLFG